MEDTKKIVTTQRHGTTETQDHECDRYTFDGRVLILKDQKDMIVQSFIVAKYVSVLVDGKAPTVDGDPTPEDAVPAPQPDVEDAPEEEGPEVSDDTDEVETVDAPTSEDAEAE